MKLKIKPLILTASKRLFWNSNANKRLFLYLKTFERLFFDNIL